MKPWIKNSIPILIGFLVGVAATSAAFRLCFHPHHPPGAADADRVLKRLDSKLNFTADQRDKVAQLLKQELPKADALRKEGDVKFQALRNSFRTQLRTLLTPEQSKKFDDMTAKWDQHNKPGCSDPVTGR